MVCLLVPPLLSEYDDAGEYPDPVLPLELPLALELPLPLLSLSKLLILASPVLLCKLYKIESTVSRSAFYLNISYEICYRYFN